MRSPHHDPAEIRRLLEIRRSEALTYEQLSTRSGVPVHVFTYRVAQDRRARGESSTEPSAFVEVVAAPTADSEEASNASGIELVLPDGLRAVLDRNFDEVALSRLLTIVQC